MLTVERIQAVDRALRIDFGELTPEDKATVESHNRAVDANSEALRSQLRVGELTVSELRRLKVSDFRKTRDGHTQRLFELLQQRCDLADQRAGILNALRASFETAVVTAENQHRDACATAEKQFSKMGISPASMDPMLGESEARRAMDRKLLEVPAVRDAMRKTEDSRTHLRQLMNAIACVDEVQRETSSDLEAFARQHLAA